MALVSEKLLKTHFSSPEIKASLSEDQYALRAIQISTSLRQLEDQKMIARQVFAKERDIKWASVASPLISGCLSGNE